MLLIMNPGSRSGRGRALWQAWEAGLRRAGIDFESVVTREPGDACRLSREAGGVDTVVAVGGDGTISEVLDGVIQSGKPGLRMGVLYSGTSPDFCRFHNIPADQDGALRCLIGGVVRKVDVVRIEYSQNGSGSAVAHFGCSCNIGMGAAVARCANWQRGLLGDTLGTGLAVLRSIMFLKAVDLELEIDGVKHSFGRVNNLSVLKNPWLASGLKLDTNLGVADGRLVVVCVHGKGRLGLCRLLPGFYSGRAAADPSVFVKECARVRVGSGEAHEVEFDGDPRGYLPVDMRVLPRALNLIGGCHE